MKKFVVLDTKSEMKLLIEPKKITPKPKEHKPWFSEETLKILFSTRG
jgi:hypothetical protein